MGLPNCWKISEPWHNLRRHDRRFRHLMDERKGRRLATTDGLHVIGLIGVVLLAKQRGLIASAADVLHRLHREAGVYLAETIVRTALESAGE